MKVIFVGPSLPGLAINIQAVIVRPPAVQGDILDAVEEGAEAIGLIDGGFEYTAPTWHKEILYALSKGVTVFGAASMGALRAAECRSFGMIGIGKIYEGYVSGDLIDDSDVALLHAPPELGWSALTEPLVNVLATLDALQAVSAISDREYREITNVARAIFYKERTWTSVMSATVLNIGRKHEIFILAMTHRVDQKHLDALALVTAIDGAAPSPVPTWRFQETTQWIQMLKQRKRV